MGFFSDLFGGKTENKRTATSNQTIEAKVPTKEKKDTQGTNYNLESNRNFLINGLAINSSLNISPVLKENEVHLGLVVDTKSKEFRGVGAVVKDGYYFVYCTITYKVIGVLNLNLKDKTTRIVQKEMFDDTTVSAMNELKCDITGQILTEGKSIPFDYVRDRGILFCGEEAESIASYLHSSHNRKISARLRESTDLQRRLFIKQDDYKDFKLVRCIASDLEDTVSRRNIINSHLFSEDGKYLASTHTPCTVYNFDKCFTITVNAKTLDVNVESIGFSKNLRRTFLSVAMDTKYDSLFNTDLGIGQVGNFLFSTIANGVYRRGNVAYVANGASSAVIIPDGCQVVFMSSLATVTSIKFPSCVNRLDTPRKNGFGKLQEVYLHENMSAKFMGSFLACLISSRVCASASIPDIFRSGSTVDKLIRMHKYEEIWEYCNAPSRSDAMAWVLNGIRVVTYK